MRIILFLIIIIVSSVLSFTTSGIENLFRESNKDILGEHMIPLGWWMLGYSIFVYSAYRLKFKNTRVLKFFLLRKILTLNRAFGTIDNKVYSVDIEINQLQEKSIKSWYTLLKDKSTTLNSCVFQSSYNKRTIQRGSLLIILKSNVENNLTLIDNETLNLYYEVFVPQAHAKEMILAFDKEQEKRMNSLENRKRAHIESIINIL